MDQNDNRDPGGKKGGRAWPRRGVAGPKAALNAAEKARLVEKARQLVYQTPPLRPEKLAAIKEALEQDGYEIDSQKLANILIAELILKR
jgi:anti-sigma28 factor (negative regulator of flagellin synthesis)